MINDDKLSQLDVKEEKKSQKISQGTRFSLKIVGKISSTDFFLILNSRSLPLCNERC